MHLAYFYVCAAALVTGMAHAATTEAPRVPRARPAVATDAVAEPALEERASAAIDVVVAPLPRPRPSIEPAGAVADWAKGVEARFHQAAVPVAEPVTVQVAAVAASADPPMPAASPPHALAAIDSLAPLPRPRPETRAPELALMMPPKIELNGGGRVAPEDAACVGRLRALGVEFSEEPPLDVGGPCSVPRPLRVTGLGSGVAIGPETILNCAETESLARWIKEAVVPSATRLLGVAPTGITHSSAYVCRNRYYDPHQKISEHAHANAIDIAAFDFADRDPVAMGSNLAGSDEAKFEAEIREASCSYFTTVLGPGSNAAHATHFHLDMAFRRGGYRLCELGAPSAVAAP